MSTESAEKKDVIDEAINTRGFLEFMNDHRGAKPEDINDPELVAERFEVFKMKEGVKKDVVQIFGEQIKTDFGIQLDSTDKDSIGKYLDSKALEDPEKIKKLKDKIDLFRTLPGEIVTLTSQIKNLGTKEDQAENRRVLETHQHKMTNVEEGNEWFGATRFIHRFIPERLGGRRAIIEDTRNMVKEYGKEIKTADGLSAVSERIKAQIAEIEGNMALIDKVEELQSKFNTARKELFGETADIKALVSAIQKKVQESLSQKLKETQTFKDLQKTQTGFETFKKSSEATETGISIDGKFKTEHQGELDKKIKGAVKEEIILAVSDVDLSSTSRFQSLEKKLSDYVALDRMGSKERDGARTVVKEALIESVKNLDTTPDSQIRRMMVNRILAKANLI